MINREIRDARTKLYRESLELKDLYSKIDDYDKSTECRQKEIEVYNKWKFYHNLIKTMEKEKNNDENK